MTKITKNMSAFQWSLIILIFLTNCQHEAVGPEFSTLSDEDQKKAENALSGMRVAAGLEVQLFASEPMIVNPTNISVDERGRVWVCEATNYRLRFNPQFSERDAGDRILILEDTNGDGKADESKVFYQGTDINAALGVAVLGDKVIVSASPHVFVFTDADGDDIPEQKDTLFITEGGVDDDHGIHAFSFGPDGRLYFNFGNGVKGLFYKDGSPVLDQRGRPVRTGAQPYQEGMALRCNPDGSDVQVLGYNFRNPFEVTVDAFGTVWQSDNDDDGNRSTRINYVMEGGNFGYKDAITRAGWRERRPGMHEEIPKRHWHQNDPGVVPNMLYTGAGSPAGICFYEGDLLPEVFHSQIIHCEALKNVVRAYPTTADGAGYRADTASILQSQDQWFRPSDVEVAPDGSIFVSDWYDAGVGGNKMDDVERGRIYRIAPNVDEYTIPEVDLSTPEGAVQALTNPNNPLSYLGWQRLAAWGIEAEPALLDLWRGQRPPYRARALSLLARIPGKTGRYLQEGLQDRDANIRITALRLARQLDGGRLLSYVATVVRDSSAAVRREAAIALKDQRTPEAAALWAGLAQQHDGRDRWYLEALGIGAENHPDLFFNAWRKLAGYHWNKPGGRDLAWRIDAEQTIPLLAEIISDPGVNPVELGRWFRSFHFKTGDAKNEVLTQFLEMEHPQQALIRSYALGQLEADYIDRNPRTRRLVRTILPSIEGTPEWLLAVGRMELTEMTPQLLEFFLNSEERDLTGKAAGLIFEYGGGDLLEKRFASASDQEKKDILRRLGYTGHEGVVEFLAGLLHAGTLDLASQGLVVNAMSNSRSGQFTLLEMLEEEKLTGNVKTAAALRLMNAWPPEIRFRAPDFLIGAKSKQGELPPIKELAQREGDAAAGKEVYSTYCSSCHKIGDEGINFGPDLSTIGAKLAKDAILSSIIYPSAGINFGYEGYTVTLKDGNFLNGYITSRTDVELTLQLMGGLSRSFPMDDIASLDPMEESLMTARLHEVMEEEDLVNLTTFLAGLE